MSVQVGIYNVGGKVPLVTDVEYTTVEWDHVLDGFGVATVTMENCSDRLLNVHPFTHELRITDDGELAFAGPVRYAPMPLQESGALEVVAYDVAYWLAVRFVHSNFDFTGTHTSVSDIVELIATNALGVMDPNLLVYLNVEPCLTIHERASRDVYDTAWAMHLETIVGKLMHMSVHGRAINFWCIDSCLRELPRAAVGEFVSFSHLARDGDTFTTHSAVYGDETLGIVGSAGGVHADWPVLVERLLEEKSYLDSGSAVAAAAARVTSRAEFSSAGNSDFEATVGCEAPWRFTRIAPGMCAPVSTPYGNLMLRIDRVSGSVNAGVVKRTIGFGEVL